MIIAGSAIFYPLPFIIKTGPSPLAGLRYNRPVALFSLDWWLAVLPILTILVLMIGLRWGGSKAGLVGWAAALLLAALRFGAGPGLLIYAQLKALWFTLDILYIIWAALLLYYVTEEAGLVQALVEILPALTPRRSLQSLLVGWVFASFLQGVSGFGVPVAVAAPILVNLGFSPLQAVLIACLGHGWAVNFGSLATAFLTLLNVTGLPGEMLAPDSAFLLGAACLFCGALVAWIAGGWKGLRESALFILIVGSIMAASQYWLATHSLWIISATGAALAGLAAGLILLKFQNKQGPLPAQKLSRLLVLSSAYLLLVVFAFSANLIPALKAWLGQVSLVLPAPSPEIGWKLSPDNGHSIYPFVHPGALLVYTSLASALLYWRIGAFRPGAIGRIRQQVVATAASTSLGILAMAGMSFSLSGSGMISLVAQGLAQALGAPLYPLAAPLIGALGAFITGSNSNSNVLFAVLQRQTAILLSLSPALILGAQTAGASLGSVFAPAKLIVGCATVGLGRQEGQVLRPALAYGLLPILFISILVLLRVLQIL
jgi:lactate permease